MKLECKDLGMNCNAVITGNTVEEVKQRAMKHAQTVHKDVLAKMTPQQLADMDKVITSKIK